MSPIKSVFCRHGQPKPTIHETSSDHDNGEDVLELFPRKAKISQKGRSTKSIIGSSDDSELPDSFPDIEADLTARTPEQLKEQSLYARLRELVPDFRKHFPIFIPPAYHPAIMDTPITGFGSGVLPILVQLICNDKEFKSGFMELVSEDKGGRRIQGRDGSITASYRMQVAGMDATISFLDTFLLDADMSEEEYSAQIRGCNVCCVVADLTNINGLREAIAQVRAIRAAQPNAAVLIATCTGECMIGGYEFDAQSLAEIEGVAFISGDLRNAPCVIETVHIAALLGLLANARLLGPLK